MSKILIIEDNDTMREAMTAIVRRSGFECAETSAGSQGIERITQEKFDLVVTDYKMKGMNGLEVLKLVKQLSGDTEVMVITAFGTIELAVEVMRQGAVDFITKPFSHDEFKLKVERIIERAAERQELARITAENAYLREEFDEQFNYGEVIGKSPRMQKIYRVIEKVAPTDSSMMIYGESGTGKELIARMIHKTSLRKNKPFIRVNCGALAEGVLESELFGHERGAFTGALKRKKGRFELAHHGSIFLDEIGDISANMQVKLLRVLQEREFERVGGEETTKVDVRILAATSKNLAELVQEGKFREDLFYRLHVIPLYLPALREKKEDIPQLTHHFLKKLAAKLKKSTIRITDSAIENLLNYSWPGNVRELENVLERAIVLCEENHIDAADLPFLANTASQKIPADLFERFHTNLNNILHAVEKQLLEKAMQKSNGNKSQAARLLGIKTNLLYYKLEKFGFIQKNEKAF